MKQKYIFLQLFIKLCVALFCNALFLLSFISRTSQNTLEQHSSWHTNGFWTEQSSTYFYGPCQPRKVFDCFHFIPLRRVNIQGINDNKCWCGYGERRTLIHCWCGCKLVQLVQKSLWRLLKKVEIDLPYNPLIQLFGNYPKDSISCYRETYTSKFIAALFILAQKLKQPRYIPVDGQIIKMWYIYFTESYSAIKNQKYEIFR